MVDFTSAIATAQRLIGNNGRSITFIGYNGTPADNAKPWDGPADPVDPSDSLTINAVGVSPSSASALGLALAADDLIKNSQLVYITSPGADFDASLYNQVTDSGTDYKISTVQVLRPADDVVLAYVGVQR